MKPPKSIEFVYYVIYIDDYYLKVGDETGLIYGFVYNGLYSPDEFTFDSNQNFQTVPKQKTVINQVSNSTNSEEATLPGTIKFKDLNGICSTMTCTMQQLMHSRLQAAAPLVSRMS